MAIIISTCIQYNRNDLDYDSVADPVIAVATTTMIDKQQKSNTDGREEFRNREVLFKYMALHVYMSTLIFISINYYSS